MKKEIKIIFFDIDGTLIDIQAGRISPRTVEALQRLRARGIKLCIATGRSPVTLPDFGGAEFDGFLTFNGSLCYDRSGVVLSHALPAETVDKLLDNAAALGRPVSIATRDRLAANGWDQDLADYYAISHLQLEPAPDFEAVRRQAVYQVMLGCRMDERAAVLAGAEGAKIAAWWDRAVDIIPTCGGKGAGVRRMLAHYGFQPEQAMAFGDGNNDLELLQAVGTGVAMANGSAELRAAADAVCGHVAQDGVYAWCVRQGLI